MITSAETYSAFKLIHEGILALARAEAVGIRVDVDYCIRTTKRLDREINYANKKFEASDLAAQWKKVYRSEVNFNSDPQLAKVVFEHMKIEPKKFTEKGNPSVDEEALKMLGLEEVDLILKVRHLTKVRDTYIGGYLRENVEGIMRPFFNLHTVVSYRSSSDRINFQNQPNRDPLLKKLCREAILPHKGQKILCADFKGCEVSGAAAYNKDPQLIKYLIDPTTDMHRDVAVDCFLTTPDQIIKPVRNTAKSFFTFAQFYGDWYKSCAENMWKEMQNEDTHKLKSGIILLDHLYDKGIKTYQSFEDQVKKVEDIFWNKRFKVYKKWKEDWYADYLKKGYFTTLSGFTCRGVMDNKQAVNYPIQGSSFHMLLLTFILLDREQDRRGWKSRLIGQIHDEMVMSVDPAEEREVIETIQHIVTVEVPKIFTWINTPLVIEVETTEVNQSWYHKKDIHKKKEEGHADYQWLDAA